MARGRGAGISVGQILMLVVFAVVGLYLFSQFSDFVGCTATDVANGDHGCEAVCTGDVGSCAANARYRGFMVPSNADQDSLQITVLKLLVLGIVIYGAYALMKKFSGQAFSQKDVLTLILLGLALWWLWDNVLMNVLRADSIGNIAWSVGQKLGVV